MRASLGNTSSVRVAEQEGNVWADQTYRTKLKVRELVAVKPAKP